MAYVLPTPGDIPKKIFSLPRADFASSRFSCARSASGSGRSVSVMRQFYSFAALSPHAKQQHKWTILITTGKSIERRQIAAMWIQPPVHYVVRKFFEP